MSEGKALSGSGLARALQALLCVWSALSFRHWNKPQPRPADPVILVGPFALQWRISPDSEQVTDHPSN